MYYIREKKYKNSTEKYDSETRVKKKICRTKREVNDGSER
jgi:hypothetical protein